MGFLNLGTSDIWVRSFFVKGLPPVFDKMFSSIPGLYLFDDNSSAQPCILLKGKMFPDITTCALLVAPCWEPLNWAILDSPRQLSLVHHKSSKRNRLIWIFLLSSCSKDKWKFSVMMSASPHSITIPPSISPCNNTNVHYYLRRHQLIKKISPSKCFTLN